MQIDTNKPLEESKKEFVNKLTTIAPDKLAQVKLELTDFNRVLTDEYESTSWWQIATQVLPPLLNWRMHLNETKDSNESLPPLVKREIFFAYLKEAITQQLEDLGSMVPPNLKTKILDFLVNLAALMTKNQITSVSTFQDEKNNPTWAIRFFGSNEKGSQFLNMIRSCAQDFIRCSEGEWRFVQNDFQELLDSINVVEMTNIESKLDLTMPRREARNAAFNVLSDALFSEPEGPYSLLKKEKMAPIKLQKPST